jgi:hypothetical protein
MATTSKIFTDNMGGTSANNYIGVTGEVFYDVTGNTPMRLSDGVTPGGIAFSIASRTTSFTPDFKTVTGETLTGAVTTGSYVKQGLIVHFRVNVDFANCSNFGANNQYQFTLPFRSVATMTIRGGTLHHVGGNALYHIAGITDNATSNTVMKLYYSGSTTDLAWKASTPVGATTNTSHFDISGAYETDSLAVT